MTDEAREEISRLPLWKEVTRQMFETGLHYGQIWTAEFFEKGLKVSRESCHYKLDITKIRKQLEPHGFYLKQQGEDQFVIIQAGDTIRHTVTKENFHIRGMKRAFVLVSAVPSSLLNEEEKKLQESSAERMGIRLALMNRTEEVARVIRKKAPDLLK